MSRYRRTTTPNASYFFTVVTYRRRPILCDEAIRNALRSAIETVRLKRPFVIDAWVLLPDHLHCVWTLPEGDADFSTRWMMIKRAVSIACGENYHCPAWLNPSKKQHRESTIWQRRFWEHQLRDADDFARHVDYIHFNPVKHRHAQAAVEWPYSTFHRFVRNGIYAPDWSGSNINELDYD